MNRKKYRRKNASLRKAIERGLSVACSRCAAKSQVPVSAYHGGRARCPSCGGPVERAHPPRPEVPAELDARRVVLAAAHRDGESLDLQ